MNSGQAGTVDMFGVSVARMTLLEAAEVLTEAAREKKTRLAFTINSDCVVLMGTNEKFREACSTADWILPDGMPLVWFSRIIGQRLPERVTGSDLLPELCRLAEKKALRVFFLGGTPDVTPKAVTNLLNRFPSLQVAGMATPWIDLTKEEETYDSLIEEINATNPDIVFIGMGAPKQEIWTLRSRSHLKTGVICSVGGTFDFIAGKTVRAPRWMQMWGLEWLWRLLYEPRRLWRRYLIGNVVFLGIAWKEWRNHRKFR